MHFYSLKLTSITNCCPSRSAPCPLWIKSQAIPALLMSAGNEPALLPTAFVIQAEPRVSPLRFLTWLAQTLFRQKLERQQRCLPVVLAFQNSHLAARMGLLHFE